MRVDIGAITNLASSDPSGKFKDPDFKANITCLGKTIDNVSFTRFPQICPDAPPSDTTGLPRNGADPGDIRQGRVKVSPPPSLRPADPVFDVRKQSHIVRTLRELVDDRVVFRNTTIVGSLEVTDLVASEWVG